MISNTLISRPHEKYLDKGSSRSCSLQRDGREIVARHNYSVRDAYANRGGKLAPIMRTGEVMLSTSHPYISNLSLFCVLSVADRVSFGPSGASLSQLLPQWRFSLRGVAGGSPRLVLEYPECGKACQGPAKQERPRAQIAF
jgi:hypothetical protein